MCACKCLYLEDLCKTLVSVDSFALVLFIYLFLYGLFIDVNLVVFILIKHNKVFHLVCSSSC